MRYRRVKGGRGRPGASIEMRSSDPWGVPLNDDDDDDNDILFTHGFRGNFYWCLRLSYRNFCVC